MTADEYALWAVWHQHEPLDVSWWQAGVVASVLANVYRGDHEPFHASDFIPRDPWTPVEIAKEIDPADFVRMNYG